MPQRLRRVPRARRAAARPSPRGTPPGRGPGPACCRAAVVGVRVVLAAPAARAARATRVWIRVTLNPTLRRAQAAPLRKQLAALLAACRAAFAAAPAAVSPSLEPLAYVPLCGALPAPQRLPASLGLAQARPRAARGGALEIGALFFCVLGAWRRRGTGAAWRLLGKTQGGRA